MRFYDTVKSDFLLSFRMVFNSLFTILQTVIIDYGRSNYSKYKRLHSKWTAIY